jgi:RNA-directed DNA polymerase
MSEETQMTVGHTTGASSTRRNSQWDTIKWPKAEAQVLQLQMRIAKAERENRCGKVKALQRLLTSSFYAKCLAVKRVTSNTGKRTAGVDGMLLQTPKQKMQMVLDLKRKDYTPLPLRRIHIRKKSGKLRPLSIPTIKDRAMQALWHTALLPIAEERADPNAYGFRPKRSTHDAIAQCFVSLSNRNSATWILEGDIKDCFSRISHDWLLQNIPMDKTILRKFLKAGFVENGEEYPTTQGVCQGGVISPTLALLALSGLERKLRSANRRQQYKEKINVIAYADDFVVTAVSEELLRDKIIPILTRALGDVGLELSQEKTKITQIEDGFNFLGFNIRKYSDGKLLTKPSKENISDFLKEIRTCIKKGAALPTNQLIHCLNEKIIGWTNYYRGSAASKVFMKIDNEIFLALKHWCLKRHARKGKKWIMQKYFTRVGNDNWRFYCITKDKEGKTKPLYLKRATDTHIRRHKKIKGEANPFNSCYKEYFKQRENERKVRSRFANTEKSAGLRIIQPYAGLSGVR